MTMTSGRDGLELRSHEVDRYFELLKEEFQDHDVKGKKKNLAEDAAKNRGRMSLDPKGVQFIRKRYDHLGDECSPRYYRYSMTEAEDVLLARQKSEELFRNLPARTAMKRHSLSSPSGEHEPRLASASKGELKDLVNNNLKDDYSELQSRHMEAALNQGKVNSLAEQTRKQRRKYFEKERKGSR